MSRHLVPSMITVSETGDSSNGLIIVSVVSSALIGDGKPLLSIALGVAAVHERVAKRAGDDRGEPFRFSCLHCTADIDMYSACCIAGELLEVIFAFFAECADELKCMRLGLE